jgi:hypothetical protein
MAQVGGGRWRVDQFQFAVAEELVDGTNPGTIACNIGLIKGGIDLPCPEYEWDVFYGVGRDGRARRDIHQGPQSFTGTIPESYILFETRLPFKMILGCLSRSPETIPCICPAADQSVFTATSVNGFTDACAVLTTFKSSCGCDRFAVFSGISVGYIGAGGAACAACVWPTRCICAGACARGWNGPQPDVCDIYEIRRICCVGFATGDKYAVGTQILPTWSWAARFRNSTTHAAVGGNMTVNYVGGKVNRATISAASGEKAILALDEVFFRDLVHDVALPTACVAKRSACVTAPTATFPTEQPLVFSEGTIGLFEIDTTFARIRNFSLEVNNNLEIERYLSTQCLGGCTLITQTPFEFVEGNREITLDVEAVMETREYWEHLMREGQNDCLNAKTGFDFRITFRRDSAAAERMVIQGPANTNPVIVADSSCVCCSVRLINSATVNQSLATNVGAVLNSAPHVISGEGENLVLVRMSINVPSIVIWWDDVT